MFRVGQKVRVKSWEEMERRYGLNNNGNIKTPAVFTKEMAKFCGKTYKIRKIDGAGFPTYEFFGSRSEKNFIWDEQMLEPLKLNILIERRKRCQQL